MNEEMIVEIEMTEEELDRLITSLPQILQELEECVLQTCSWKS